MTPIPNPPYLDPLGQLIKDLSPHGKHFIHPGGTSCMRSCHEYDVKVMRGALVETSNAASVTTPRKRLEPSDDSHRRPRAKQPDPYSVGGTFYSEPRIEPHDPPRSGFVLVYVVAALGVALLIGYVVLRGKA